MLELYENIKKWRLARGMTQTDLAMKVGYSDKSMIAKIEKGLVDLPQSKIEELANALWVSPADLMGWTKKEEYYTDTETSKMAQELFDNPDYRMLFDAAKDSKPEDIKMVADMLTRLKQTNPDG